MTILKRTIVLTLLACATIWSLSGCTSTAKSEKPKSGADFTGSYFGLGHGDTRVFAGVDGRGLATIVLVAPERPFNIRVGVAPDGKFQTVVQEGSLITYDVAGEFLVDGMKGYIKRREDGKTYILDSKKRGLGEKALGGWFGTMSGDDNGDIAIAANFTGFMDVLVYTTQKKERVASRNGEDGEILGLDSTAQFAVIGDHKDGVATGIWYNYESGRRGTWTAKNGGNPSGSFVATYYGDGGVGPGGQKVFIQLGIPESPLAGGAVLNEEYGCGLFVIAGNDGNVLGFGGDDFSTLIKGKFVNGVGQGTFINPHREGSNTWVATKFSGIDSIYKGDWEGFMIGDYTASLQITVVGSALLSGSSKAGGDDPSYQIVGRIDGTAKTLKFFNDDGRKFTGNGTITGSNTEEDPYKCDGTWQDLDKGKNGTFTIKLPPPTTPK